MILEEYMRILMFLLFSFMLDNWSVAWTRKVEINNAREIGEIFDAISYRKGASEGEGSSTVLCSKVIITLI
ncbi:unnamed protein product [Trifolium pratense]|uniref:Uncharacterized protein n=2 Tax=Trifolium pratense TaxID=57577 RepID=A0ACB0KSY0_TRIPR|nr:unnamed protein product [Trifolium pratense]CAJ2675551.1 unnamed protein product [Trifolium pratense]